MEALQAENSKGVAWLGKSHRSLAAVPFNFVEATLKPLGRHDRVTSHAQAPDSGAADDPMGLLHRVGGSLPSLRWRTALLAREGQLGLPIRLW
jgi:hypothetical protein